LSKEEKTIVVILLEQRKRLVTVLAQPRLVARLVLELFPKKVGVRTTGASALVLLHLIQKNK